MSDDKYEALFSLIMNITTGIHMPLKIFAIYVIVRHTPPELRHYSYFTLNTMFWNFLCNFVTAFIHFYPLFPAPCFRADGIASYFITSEEFGYWLFILIAFLIVECSLALLFAFPHRYIVFVHPKLASRIRPLWGFALCAAVHVVLALFYLPVTSKLTVSFQNFPNMPKLPDTLFDFCFNPIGMLNVAVTCLYAAGIAVGILIIVVSSVLFLRKVRKLQREITHEETLTLQKKVFANLLTITAVAMIFGGIPFMVMACALVFPSAPYSREITVISMMILANHGSISAVANLVFFKAYRKAVKRIFSDLVDRLKRRKMKVHSVVAFLKKVSVALPNVK